LFFNYRRLVLIWITCFERQSNLRMSCLKKTLLRNKIFKMLFDSFCTLNYYKEVHVQLLWFDKQRFINFRRWQEWVSPSPPSTILYKTDIEHELRETETVPCPLYFGLILILDQNLRFISNKEQGVDKFGRGTRVLK